MKKPIGLFDDIPLSEPIKKNKKEPSKGYLISSKFLKEYYIPKYTELFSIPPKISWGKEMRLLNKILKIYSNPEVFGCDNQYDFLVKSCDKFFLSKEPFIIKGCWSIGCFYTLIDKIALSLKNSENDIINQLQVGYKLAFWNYTGNKFEGSLVSTEGIFSHIYLILKEFWIKYGKGFRLDRFSEIYFLVILSYNQNRQINLDYFVSKQAQNYFKQWIEEEGRESLRFFPKDVGKLSKEELLIKQDLMISEETQLIKNRK